MNRAVNLMTLYARRCEILRTRLRQWRSVFAALLILLATTSACHYYFVHRTQLKQQFLETTLEPINHLKEKNKQLAKQIDAIRNEEKFVLELSSRESTVTLLGLLGSAVATAGEGVFLEKVEISRPRQSSTTTGNSALVVDVAGIADKNSAANQVADELKTALPFGEVDVKANKETRVKNLLMHTFSLQGAF